MTQKRPLYEKLVLNLLTKMPLGRMNLTLPTGEQVIIGNGEGVAATVRIHRASFFKRCVLYGDIGFGEGYVEGDCASYNIGNGHPYLGDMRFLVVEDKVIGLNIFVPGIKTTSGLQVGSAITEVRYIYSGHFRETDAYGEGRMLIVRKSGATSELVFLYDKERVREIRAGLPEATQASEGCL